jgi:hypothetical protein
MPYSRWRAPTDAASAPLTTVAPHIAMTRAERIQRASETAIISIDTFEGERMWGGAAHRDNAHMPLIGVQRPRDRERIDDGLV